MEGIVLILLILFIWVLPSFLVAMTGNNKSIGYWGVFFLSLILSPLIGLIIGLASGPKVKTVTPVQGWKCSKCGQSFTGLLAACSNCGQPMNYPATAYDNIKYTCNNCKKFFFGRKSECPHCNTKMNY